jgi:hypothetical protein
MPSFPHNPLTGLDIGHEQPDRTIELGSLPASDALRQVDALIDQAPAGYRYCLRFDPPLGDGAETLFQPLGRYLLEQRRAGRLARCLPMQDGAGFFVEIPGD